MAETTAQKIKIKTGKAVTIRTARPDDAKAVNSQAKTILTEDLFNASTLEELRPKLAIGKQRRRIREFIKQPGRVLLVAELDGRIAGILDAESSPRKRMQHVGTLHLSVHPKFRRRGIATALMKAAIDWAKKNPVIEKLTLEVFRTNRPAIRLYEKTGFKREGLGVKGIKLEDGRYVDIVMMARFVKGGDMFLNRFV